jgi:cationic peptide transport system substrate-binding protein
MRHILIYSSLLFLTACYQTESTLTNSLIYCTDKGPSSLNPQISHDTASLDATTHQLYNRLVKIDPVSQRFISDISTHWDINKQKTHYTFYLRKDVNFHTTEYFKPTRTLNADDVIFSFQRMLSKIHPFHTINIESENYLFNHPLSNLVKDVVKIDEYSIRFLLNNPDATLLANLAAHYGVIHSAEYATKLLKAGTPEKIDYFPIGTGPYQFKNNSSNRVIRYQKHLFPWSVAGNIENLIFDITTNSSKRYAKLLSGECDIIADPALSQVDQISDNASVSISIKPTSNVSLIAFNSKKTPFDKVAIRHALSSAIDLDTVIKAVFFGNAISTNNLLPAQAWRFNPHIEKYHHSPEQIIEILTANKFDFTQTLRILAPIKKSIFNPNFYKTAELIQSNWADVGVKSEIILLRGIDLDKALVDNEYDLFLTGKSPNIKDPDNLFRPLLSCNINQLEGNTSQWCDETTQQLLDATLLEANFNQRVKNYYKLQEIIQSQRIYLPIAHLLRFYVFNKNISNIQVNPLTGIDFHNVKKVTSIDKVKGY